MRTTERRLCALNLVLLLLLAFAFPQRAEAAWPGYDICVDGHYFGSNREASGTGWSYSDGTLRLNGYQGQGILASGDLTVYAEGEVQVKGADTSSRHHGIEVDGQLQLVVNNGTITVRGGAGPEKGGHAISAGTFSATFNGTGSKGIFIGGSAKSGADTAGNGIRSLKVTLTSDTLAQSHFTIRGGSATSSAGCTGGIGIFAADIAVNGSGSIYGGSGNIGSPAIHYETSCAFGLANLTIKGGDFNSGGISAAPVHSGSASPKWSHHAHTTVTETSSTLSVAINRYKMRLSGQGGTWEGLPDVTMDNPYPASYSLAGYVFSREGYVQVCWADPDGKTIPLDTVYTPEKDIALDAVWKRSAQSYGLADFELVVDYANRAVSVTPKSSWVSSLSKTGARNVLMALYDSSGRLLDVAAKPYASSGVSTITLRYAGYPLPVLRVFAVDRWNRPAAKERIVDLSTL